MTTAIEANLMAGQLALERLQRRLEWLRVHTFALPDALIAASLAARPLLSRLSGTVEISDELRADIVRVHDQLWAADSEPASPGAVTEMQDQWADLHLQVERAEYAVIVALEMMRALAAE